MAKLPSNILPLHKREKQNRVNGPNATTNTSNGKPFTSKWRNELVATAAEFAGTFMFLFFAFGGTQVAKTAAFADNAAAAGQEKGRSTPALNTSALLFISLSFGFSLAINVWVFFRVSGGLFNPAVTLGLYLIDAISAIRAGCCFVAQMLAGICSAAVIEAILPGPLNVSTTLVPGTSIARGVFLEMFLTSLLVFTIFMLAAEKHKATYLAPIGIGLSLFVAEMVGVFFTGGSLNPARSFGPCVATAKFPGYHYIYWFGPLMGTLLAFGMYKIVKLVEYQTVNPGQDFGDHEAELFKPPANPTDRAQVQRPNVAAIVAEEAVRMASRSSGSVPDGIDGRMSQEDRISPVASRLSELGREREQGTHGVRD
ncbi:aquaporin-like protein [Zopfia rhizophila CBS 207.26]|uniref:Aquaporin-like protein n=1 Tax=Zopfia rhizophila CBS 207.26 TaxID=1314779 RepID=A0A6A6DYZ2_9PEZI|nr:aquaporin-like protein [Zopfia rhizophila CBS 207.26]